MEKSRLDLVSVIIPVYNAENYLEEALASVYRQTYPNIEIIVVDDGSQDRSVALLESYLERIVLIKQTNSGPAVARNRGARKAKGKWVAFLDADDIWDADKIKKQLLLCNDLVWSYTDAVFMGGINDGVNDSKFTLKFDGSILEQLICSNFIGTSSILIQRQIFLDSGGFDESLSSIEDWELWIRLASNHKIAYVDEPLVKYRVHAASTSRNSRKTLPNHISVIDKVFASDNTASGLKHLMPLAKAESYDICSQIAEEEGDFGFALKCAIFSCRYEPLRFQRWERAIKSLIKYCIFLLPFKKNTAKNDH